MPRTGVFHTRTYAQTWDITPLNFEPPRVDRANRMIHGAVAMLANVEALGWNMFSDDKTLAMATLLANAITLGIPMRAGHPGVSENAYGAKFATCKNFYVENGALRHDIQFLDAAKYSHYFHGTDPSEYVMSMADERPDQIGESFVMDIELVWTFADGSEQPYEGMYPPEKADLDAKPDGALTPMPVMRPVEIVFLDMVGDGALTHNGLFANAQIAQFAVGANSEVSAELFSALDALRLQFRIPLDQIGKKAQTFIGQYVQSRRGTMAVQQQPHAQQGIGGNRTMAHLNDGGVQPIIEPTAPAAATEPVADEQPVITDEPAATSEDELAALEAEVDETVAEAEQQSAADELEPQQIDSSVLTSHYAMLADQNRRMFALLGKLNAAQKATNARVAALEGEGIMSGQLGTLRAGGASGLRQKPPAPKPATQTKPIGSVTGRNQDVALSMPTDAEFEADPVGATLRANMARQQGAQTGTVRVTT